MQPRSLVLPLFATFEWLGKKYGNALQIFTLQGRLSSFTASSFHEYCYGRALSKGISAILGASAATKYSLVVGLGIDSCYD